MSRDKKIYYSISFGFLITGILLIAVLSHTGNKITLIRILIGIVFVIISILMFRNSSKSNKR